MSNIDLILHMILGWHPTIFCMVNIKTFITAANTSSKCIKWPCKTCITRIKQY
uniref:Uncharacterized protein n=1 Tax=Octopus bimaculoides TaxID=37653 RepID=A0A0L8FR76_OCTBM